jgi:hypothetical protein
MWGDTGIQVLTRPEAKLLALHLNMNPHLETVELNVDIPIAEIRRDLCAELHYGGEFMSLSDVIVLRSCLRPVHCFHNLAFITLTNARARWPVGGLRTDIITELVFADRQCVHHPTPSLSPLFSLL